MQRSLVIVIPYWHGESFLAACLESISHSAFGNDIRCSVLIVFNGGQYPELSPTMQIPVEIVSTEENIGFARAVNVGLQHVLEGGVDMIAILNQDTVVSADCFRQLLSVASSAIAFYAPLIMNYQMTFVPSWYSKKYYSQEMMPSKHLPFEVRSMSGTCVLGSRETWARSGYFDPVFYMYYEDDDYFDRVRSSGGKLFVVPGAQVGHFSGSTESEDGSRLWKRMGLLKYFARHRSQWALCRKILRHYTGAIVKGDFSRFAGYVRHDRRMLSDWKYLRHATHDQINARALEHITKDKTVQASERMG